MTSRDIEARILRVLKKRFTIDDGRYSLAADFVKEFGFDSYDTANLLLALEKEFSIDIEDRDLERITTVGDVNELVAQCLMDSEAKIQKSSRQPA